MHGHLREGVPWLPNLQPVCDDAGRLQALFEAGPAHTNGRRMDAERRGHFAVGITVQPHFEHLPFDDVHGFAQSSEQVVKLRGLDRSGMSIGDRTERVGKIVRVTRGRAVPHLPAM